MGTFGRLTIGELFTCLTVEDEWKWNALRVSCIPHGVYTLKWDRFHAGGYDCYQIEDVPGRSRILMHVANTETDLEGCVGLGREWGYIQKKWGVIHSTTTLRDFHLAMKEAEPRLRIRWARQGEAR
jgi:hypothetical protein